MIDGNNSIESPIVGGWREVICLEVADFSKIPSI